ncbi:MULTISPECIES: TetR/AcrR family transcriptional regulator [unclassified Streptomyces]|uniref:TetR/AcrR family transcriptional regulator n=1 Tax=Streptomyces sp. NBC_00119 TaxID=2975659 RepID=A0AAU1U8N9_9ACTN|nr:MULTISPECIES: TetR/AcrR family transcriptional regulator [unclassified Streptomyces]MCX4643204.1 TetR/AcrR family transcriptional regulator [Streptomyces sp. NBC_01446]MCX5324326.1 TetR/AcrR family transcriptional regulator [Streptomyces sp. NBC_00120]
MSPRGVAIPDVRERLFDAAERILAREGPSGLTSRAITTEAGCAKGMLHKHFAGLDELVAELVLARFAGTARLAEDLPGRAGESTVAANLKTIGYALLTSLNPTTASLAVSTPAASLRIREALEAGAPGFDAIQRSIADYLDAEVERGRLAPATDTTATALALVGTVHHLLMTTWGDTARDPGEQTERLVTMLLGPTTGGSIGHGER